jgi:hypothetical protein
MQLEKFVMRELNKGAYFGSKMRGMSFKTYRGLAELTKFVDFKCEFDKLGRCKNYKSDPPEKGVTMCCCNACFYETGYLHSFPTGGWRARSEDRLKELKTYARHFSEKISYTHGVEKKMGFWRPGKGCSLPRSYRSPICLTYKCDSDDKPWEKVLFRLIQGHVEFPVAINDKGHKYNENNIVAAMVRWHKELEENDKDNSK